MGCGFGLRAGTSAAPGCHRGHHWAGRPHPRHRHRTCALALPGNAAAGHAAVQLAAGVRAHGKRDVSKRGGSRHEHIGLSACRRQLGRLTALINEHRELICTAAMIAPQYILTAAHCVYLPVTGFIQPSVTNYAAGQEDAGVTPYGVVTAQQTFVPTGYSTRADKDTTDTNYDARRQYDWAVIKLQSAVGLQASALPRAATGVRSPLMLMQALQANSSIVDGVWHLAGLIQVHTRGLPQPSP